MLFIVISCLITYQSSLGGFRHLFYVPPEHLSEVAKVNYIFQVVGIFSYVTAKASVGYLILKILGPKSFWRKWSIWFIVILTFISNSINCILTFAQCDPPRALWELQIPAKCWDPKVQLSYALWVGGKNLKSFFNISI